jgi:hypothetical protein
MTLGLVGICAVTALYLSESAFAQEAAAPPTVSLNAFNFASGVIGASERAMTRTLTIDKARAATIVVATTEDVSVSIGLPDGSTVDAGKARRDDMSWQSFAGRGEAAPLELPGFGSSFNTLVTVATPPSGSYALNLARKNDSGAAIPFVATVIMDSDLRMGLWVHSTQVLRGEPFALNAILLDGEKPADNARIQAIVTRAPADGNAPADRIDEQALVDDGRQGVDAKAGDGVFSGVITPQSAGLLQIAIRARGRSAAGADFERDAGLAVVVSEPKVKIGLKAATTVSSDRLAPLIVPIELKGEPGDYQVVAQIRGGKTNTANLSEGQIVKLPGATNVEIVFPAERLATLGPDRPYAVVSVDAYEITKDDRILRGRLIPAPTQP